MCGHCGDKSNKHKSKEAAKKIATKINFTRNRVGDEVRAKKPKLGNVGADRVVESHMKKMGFK